MKRVSRSIGYVLAVVLLSVAGGEGDPRAAEPQEQAVDEKADDVLKEREEATPGEPFRYDPGGRRDPFMSLDDLAKANEAPRPDGIAGMSTDDLDLEGTIETPNGAIAQVSGSDGKSYFLRVGERTYDAVVIAIDSQAGTLTLRQQVRDPRAIKPYRDRVLRVLPEGTAGS